jgi:hypothetical protein
VGFGAWYTRVRKDPATPEVLSDWLGLVGYEAKAEDIARWPLERRVEAEVYAVNVHLRASDNAIRRCPKPEWFPEPWQGPELQNTHVREDLRGAFDGPSGTQLTCPECMS